MKVTSLGVCPWRECWDPGCFPSFCAFCLTWGDGASSAVMIILVQSRKTETSKTVNQSNPFFLLRWLPRVFCLSSRRQRQVLRCLHGMKNGVQSRRVAGCTSSLVLFSIVPRVWEAGGTTFALGISISIFYFSVQSPDVSKNSTGKL